MSTSRLPPCEAIGPDGHRIAILPSAPTDTVGDLARALALPPNEPLTIDGRACNPHLPLLRSGLRVGSRITLGPEPPADPTPNFGAMIASSANLAPNFGRGDLGVGVTTGPTCRSWVRLGVGRHVIGRADTADFRIEDPDVELHHGVLDVGVDATVVFSQLTGRVPARIDDRACLAMHPVEIGQTLQLGTSRIEIREWQTETESANIVHADHDPWRQIVRRSPTADDGPGCPEIEVPEQPTEQRGPPAIGLVGAAIAVAGAGLMAAALGQLLLALFAAVGAIASLSTWLIGSLGALRLRRRAHAEYRRRLGQFAVLLDDRHDVVEGRHRVDHLSVVDVLAIIEHGGARLWERRPRDGPLRATIGRGTCRWDTGLADDQRRTLQPDLLAVLERCERLVDVPVPVDLDAGTVVALRGELGVATAVARSLVVQLAGLHGPADWRLVVVTDRPAEWDWVDWLPQTRAGGGVVPSDEVARLGDLDAPCDRSVGPATVVVTDVPGLLAARTGPLRRLLATTDGSCIVLTSEVTAPAVCRRVLDVGVTGTARWSHGADASEGDGASEIRWAGISRTTAAEAARRMAPLVDPEAGDASSMLPAEIRLGDLDAIPNPRVAAGAATVVRRWRSHGDDPPLTAAIGVSTDGVVDIDLVRDGPHGLIAGTTGSGKSELLRTLVVALAANVGPEHVTFVLVDFKGGSTFDACARLPHTVGVVTDLDDALAARALVSLEAEVRRRERLLRAVGAADLTEYRSRTAEALPRLVVVVDEFAGLAKEFPGVLAALVGVAQRGRSLGLHLLLATQRPAGVVTDDIRANTNLRLALRLNDRADAQDVVGDDMPAMFPRSIAGRAALRLGPDELVVFQTASCTGLARRGPEHLRVESLGTSLDTAPDVHRSPSELDEMVKLLRDAAAIAGTPPPHRPWLPPLPSVVTVEDIERGAVGIVDDPANQRRLPLRWDHTAGNLLLVGGLGSGTTTTAITLVVALVRESGPPGRHVYVIDGRGDPAWDAVADGVDECGAVVRLHEGERLLRLLTRLSAEVDRRNAGSHDVLLVIDGLGATRIAVAALDLGEASALLERVLREGPSAGIVTCATTDGGATMPTTDQWIFRTDDPAAASASGRLGATVAAGVPGRLHLAESGLAAQVVWHPDGVGCVTATGRRAPRIEVLPTSVRPEELCADEGRPSPSGVVELLVGLASADLSAASLRVPIGDHVFVGGVARTGRTTALRQLAAAWHELHPGSKVVWIDRRTTNDVVLASRGDRESAPMLLVVDDADRVTDPTGLLADVVAGRHPGVMIVASARLEAARVAYGHWIRDVARCHCGLILTAAGEVDGELLGTVLPRRTPMPARPGLAWMIDGRGHQLVQVADRMIP